MEEFTPESPELLKTKEEEKNLRETIKKILALRGISLYEKDKSPEDKEWRNIRGYKERFSLEQVFIGKNASPFLIQRLASSPSGVPAQYQYLFVYNNNKETIQKIEDFDQLGRQYITDIDGNEEVEVPSCSVMKIKEIVSDNLNLVKIKIEYVSSWGRGECVVEKIIDVNLEEDSIFPPVDSLTFGK